MNSELHPPFPFSIWERDIYHQSADVLIVGAGITGLSAACFLKQRNAGLQVTVVDQNIAPSGASTRNAGFACFGSLGELLDDMAHQPEDKVWELVARRWNGFQLLCSLVPPENMNYERCGGGELFADERSYENAARFIPEANRIMQQITGEPDVLSEDQLENHNIIRNRIEGALHSGKMVQSLQKRAELEGVTVCRGYKINNVETGRAEIEGIGVIKADHIILATNGYSQMLDENLPVDPARGYVLVTEPLEHQPWHGTFHYDRGYVYFRHLSENRLLIGGCRNLDSSTEKTTQTGINPVVKNGVTGLVKDKLLPHWDGKIQQEWTGIMGFGPGKMPLVKQYRRGVVLAAGLSGMGVALGADIGRQAADMISNSHEPD